ncbi:MAG: hypothetical protein R3A10_19570 [Caldilineaceae bacterium]
MNMETLAVIYLAGASGRGVARSTSGRPAWPNAGVVGLHGGLHVWPVRHAAVGRLLRQAARLPSSRGHCSWLPWPC